MLIVFLFAQSLAFDSILQDGFQVEFDPKCIEYFVAKNDSAYAYFYRNHETLTLWVTSNQSIEIYTINKTDHLIFEWPAKTVNSIAMERVLFDKGVVTSFDFKDEDFLCDVYNISTGIIFPAETSIGLYKCPIAQWSDDKAAYFIALLELLIFGLLFGNESIRAVFQSEVCRIFQRRSKILQSSESYQPARIEEGSI